MQWYVFFYIQQRHILPYLEILTFLGDFSAHSACVFIDELEITMPVDLIHLQSV